MGRFRFFFTEAFGSLRRNYFMTIAAVLTVLLSMTVLGVVIVFASNVDGLLKDLKGKVEITVYLLDSTTSEQIEQLQSEIVSWDEVKDSKFISKEEALVILKEDFKDHPEVVESLAGNPLPASFEISLKDPEQADVVAARFDGRPEVEEVGTAKRSPSASSGSRTWPGTSCWCSSCCWEWWACFSLATPSVCLSSRGVAKWRL